MVYMVKKTNKQNFKNKSCSKSKTENLNVNQLDNFKKIKKIYDEFHTEMLSKGRLMLKDTGIGFWGISSSSELFELFIKTQLDKHKRFIDLGSGDGRAVQIAQLFTKATGIEYDDELHNFSVNLAKKTEQEPLLINEDYMNHSLKNYDYIFINPDNNISDYLEDKLLDELHPKAKLVVYGAHKHPKRMNKIQTLDIQGTLVNIFQKPNN
jgi:SAM-dependent methyltransferase